MRGLMLTSSRQHTHLKRRQRREFNRKSPIGSAMPKAPHKITSAILAILVGVEAIGIVDQALAPELATGGLNFQAITGNVFLLLAPFSPLLIVLILYSWIGRIIVWTVTRYDINGFLVNRFRFLSRISHFLPVSWDGKEVPLLQHPIAVLGIGMVSACALAYTPYRSDINPGGTPVGVDTPLYIQWVNQMLQRPIFDALGYAFSKASNGSRPLSLIFPYAIASLFGVQADVAVKFYPLFLAPLLVVASFLFVYLGLGDKRTAGLVGLMTAFSFQFTVGMWAGYYANWLALAESYLLLGMLLRFASSGSKTGFAGIVLFSLALLFTHPWTWDLMILLSIIFMIERSIRSHDFRRMRLIILIGIINVAADAIKSFVLGGYSGGRAGLDIATSSLGFSQLPAFSPNIVALFDQYYDGLMADALVLIFALLVIWRSSFGSNGFLRLLVWWVALASLPFPFLGSVLQTRIVYLLPIPVLASAAIIGIEKLGQGRVQRALILSLILLYCANYSLSSILHV